MAIDRETKETWRLVQGILGVRTGRAVYLIHPHSICQNSITEPHWIAGDAAKCNLAKFPGREQNVYGEQTLHPIWLGRNLYIPLLRGLFSPVSPRKHPLTPHTIPTMCLIVHLQLHLLQTSLSYVIHCLVKFSDCLKFTFLNSSMRFPGGRGGGGGRGGEAWEEAG